MQANIAMKFAEYVIWILLCVHSKFGEKNFYISRDIEFFIGGYFFMAHPVQMECEILAMFLCYTDVACC